MHPVQNTITGRSSPGFPKGGISPPLSPFQEKLIPYILKGKDVAVQVAPGSGKTVGFVLPLILGLRGAGLAPRAVILASSPDGGGQGCAGFARISRIVRDAPAFVPLGEIEDARREQRRLEKGATIVAGTSERVIDHIRRGGIGFGRAADHHRGGAGGRARADFIKDVQFIFAKIADRRRPSCSPALRLTEENELFAAPPPGRARRQDPAAPAVPARPGTSTSGPTAWSAPSSWRGSSCGHPLSAASSTTPRASTPAGLPKPCSRAASASASSAAGSGSGPGGARAAGRTAESRSRVRTRRAGCPARPTVTGALARQPSWKSSRHRMSCSSIFPAREIRQPRRRAKRGDGRRTGGPGAGERARQAQEAIGVTFNREDIPGDEEVLTGAIDRLLRRMKTEDPARAGAAAHADPQAGAALLSAPFHGVAPEILSSRRGRRPVGQSPRGGRAPVRAAPRARLPRPCGPAEARESTRGRFGRNAAEPAGAPGAGPCAHGGKPAAEPVPSRAASGEFTQLFVSIGRNRRVFARDLTALFTEKLQLAAGEIGDVRVFEKYSFVDIVPPGRERPSRGFPGTELKGAPSRSTTPRRRKRKRRR